MSVLFHPLRVRAIEPNTAEAVVVSFEVPAALRETFGFTQGQYLTLRHTIDGQDLRRSYSICAGVDDEVLRVGVRKVRGGVFSNWINAELKVGDTLQVMAPQGRFFVPLQPDARRHFVGIAGGSGITPILSIMKTVLAREPGSRFTLIYGNRTLQSTMFKEELEDLKNRYLTRLALHHVFSDEQTDADIHHGLMNRAKLADFLAALVPAQGIAHAFVCGPFQMNDEAEGRTGRRRRGRGPHPHRTLRRGARRDHRHRRRGGAPDPARRRRRRAHHHRARRPVARAGVPQGPAQHPRRRQCRRHGGALQLHLGRVRHLPRQGARRPGPHGAQFRARQERGGPPASCCAARPIR